MKYKQFSGEFYRELKEGETIQERDLVWASNWKEPPFAFGKTSGLTVNKRGSLLTPEGCYFRKISSVSELEAVIEEEKRSLASCQERKGELDKNLRAIEESEDSSRALISEAEKTIREIKEKEPRPVSDCEDGWYVFSKQKTSQKNFMREGGKILILKDYVYVVPHSEINPEDFRPYCFGNNIHKRFWDTVYVVPFKKG